AWAPVAACTLATASPSHTHWTSGAQRESAVMASKVIFRGSVPTSTDWPGPRSNSWSVVTLLAVGLEADEGSPTRGLDPQLQAASTASSTAEARDPDMAVLPLSTRGRRLQVERRGPQRLPLLGQAIERVRRVHADAALDAALHLRTMGGGQILDALVGRAQVVGLAHAVVHDVPRQHLVAPAPAEEVEARVQAGGLHPPLQVHAPHHRGLQRAGHPPVAQRQHGLRGARARALADGVHVGHLAEGLAQEL